MSFVPKTQPSNAKINAVTLGTGDKAVVLGGQNVLPFYTFDAAIEHAPKIGVEISDAAQRVEGSGYPQFYAGCETMADYAKKAETMPGADFLVLHFESADPNGANRSIEECVADASRPLPMWSPCPSSWAAEHRKKDGELFSKIAPRPCRVRTSWCSLPAAGLQRPSALPSPLAYGQKVGAETADDINLAKQLNIMLKGPDRSSSPSS